MRQPEEILVEALNDAGILAFTTLDDSDHEQFCVIVRTSASKAFADVNRVFEVRSFNFLVHCYKVGSKEELVSFSELVTSVIEDIYWVPGIGALTLSDGGFLPSLGEFKGYTLSLAFDLTDIF